MALFSLRQSCSMVEPQGAIVPAAGSWRQAPHRNHVFLDKDPSAGVYVLGSTVTDATVPLGAFFFREGSSGVDASILLVADILTCQLLQRSPALPSQALNSASGRRARVGQGMEGQTGVGFNRIADPFPTACRWSSTSSTSLPSRGPGGSATPSGHCHGCIGRLNSRSSMAALRHMERFGLDPSEESCKAKAYSQTEPTVDGTGLWSLAFAACTARALLVLVNCWVLVQQKNSGAMVVPQGWEALYGVLQGWYFRLGRPVCHPPAFAGRHRYRLGGGSRSARLAPSSAAPTR